MDWEQNANGEEPGDQPVPMFAKWLKPKRMIEVSTRYKALEPEDEEEEESKTEREEQEEDRKSDQYGNEDDDNEEPGNMFKPEDPDSRADKVCPCGGIRNWYQRNCDCGMAMYWPVEADENVEHMFRCRDYRDQKMRWRRRGRKQEKKVGENDELEDWEKEELAAMWKFQGACDANKIMHELEKQIQKQNKQI